MDEIMNTSSLPDTPVSVKQEGEKNLFIDNNNGGIVNINYTAPQTQGISAEQILAISKFSKQYYQLIVSNDPDMFTTNIATIPAERALPQYLMPDGLFDRLSSLSDDAINELKTYPAIVCHENEGYKGETGPDQTAFYCYIRKINVIRGEIKIVFQPIAAFPQSVLCDQTNAIFFGLVMDCSLTDLNHSAWSVHRADLFEAFREAGLNNMPGPQ